jgi:hypothetical protein
MKRNPGGTREETAAEALELGRALFEALIEAAERPPAENTKEFPAAEVQAAADEFFCALHLLLGLQGEPDGPQGRFDRGG